MRPLLIFTSRPRSLIALSLRRRRFRGPRLKLKRVLKRRKKKRRVSLRRRSSSTWKTNNLMKKLKRYPGPEKKF
jgi:hypothetical protein